MVVIPPLALQTPLVLAALGSRGVVSVLVPGVHSGPAPKDLVVVSQPPLQGLVLVHCSFIRTHAPLQQYYSQQQFQLFRSESMEIPFTIEIKVKIMKNDGFITIVEISPQQETFSEFKKKIGMLHQGDISQMTWKGKSLNLNKDDNLMMNKYLQKFLGSHTQMNVGDLETAELQVAIQEHGGARLCVH